ncbi:unnamed protein product [Miscanthus lutarioriparius]|uniref:Uncharacterized protein n=1 Tax=Miscanthus lutarioriparius TaxID=422564 RepID=A0A811QGF4_9POAL|nr:unnamed protein product [Miscanthus lutarioriparius]
MCERNGEAAKSAPRTVNSLDDAGRIRDGSASWTQNRRARRRREEAGGGGVESDQDGSRGRQRPRTAHNLDRARRAANGNLSWVQNRRSRRGRAEAGGGGDELDEDGSIEENGEEAAEAEIPGIYMRGLSYRREARITGCGQREAAKSQANCHSKIGSQYKQDLATGA